MSNLLDMIEEGETDLPEVDTSPKKNPTPDENVVTPSSGQSVAGSKVFKDINLSVAKSVVFEIKNGMNSLLDVLRNHDYSGRGLTFTSCVQIMYRLSAIGRLNSEKFQNFHFKPILPFLKEIHKNND